MRQIITGDDRYEETQQFINNHESEYRRIIVISAVEFSGKINHFKKIPIDILESAVKICDRYPNKVFPFLFIFHNMVWDLNQNKHPVYNKFFKKTQWIVTSIRDSSMPPFINLALKDQPFKE